MTDRSKLAETAARYPSLQGLLFVPIGAWLALGSLTSSGWWPWKGGVPSRELYVMAPATVLGVWALVRLNRYYVETYGRVAAPRAVQVRLGVGVVAGMVAIVAASVIDSELRPPVNTSGLAVAGAMLAFWHAARILRPHHWAVVSPVLALSVVPWGTVQDGPAAGAPTTLLGLAIATMIAGAGLLDHARLVRLFDETSRLDAVTAGDGHGGA